MPGAIRLAGASVGVLWAAALLLLCRRVVAGYFPLADEWSILADSLPGPTTGWLTEGFSRYLETYPGHAVSAQFIRPLFNLGYWMCGAVFGSNFGGWLLVNYLAIGCCAALVCHCINSQRTLPAVAGVVLAALFPCVPSLLSEPFGQVLFLPMMAYEVVACVACLGAYIAYGRGRYATSAVLLGAAILTKESALPALVAFPLAHAARTLAATPRARAESLVLTLPVMLWLGLRLLAFGSPLDGTYPIANLREATWPGQALGLLRLPLHAPLPQDLLHGPAALLVGANAVVLVVVATLLWGRWRERSLDPADVTFALALPFTALLAAQTPRLGLVLHAFLFVVLARPAAGRRTPALRRVASAALVVYCAAQAATTAARWPAIEAHALRAFAVSQRYADALRDAGQRPVVMLNDPATPFSSPQHLARALGLPEAERSKASDFPWLFFGGVPACAVAVTGGERRAELRQDCGFVLWGVPAPPADGSAMRLSARLLARFPESRATPPDWGTLLRVESGDGDPVVLYFDPGSDAIRRLAPPP